ncbi:restriction endonuclease subunit S [Psychrobacter vallis]|uniref:restriction endonuclease subunit S n=1 Tax=Psychrobacter vallis TaxID=248451 RepID=UPI001917C36A|nr:restriction endonuclease subunit S [Psychrobacter vallis]
MKKFLDEEVTYVRDDEVETAFRFYKNDPVETQKAIKAMFRRLKFFTNNDFAFIDVHNERLFQQNSVVLLKIVKMLQDIRLKTNEENQFLGDMFEGFLDQGVKQSEGQFFTPMPIVKFIMNALPLDKIIATSEEIPKVIDYACGAGHFLNEYASSIRPIIENDPAKNLAEYYDSITGIEKEYRLSKVAKVSAFMYGQDDINIIYADALGGNEDIKNNTYSILVANPPYSVKGFLDTLKPSERRQFELLNYIDEKSYTVNNSIETFFIERAKQLLKTDGVAAIIVPSSILTKGKASSTSSSKNIYVATREILLKYFDIVAIAEFGSGTFGKTGTNTVTLFLRRKTTDAPSEADHYAERVEHWFNPIQNSNASTSTSVDTSTVFDDNHFIDDYCAHLELDADNYKTLLVGAPNEALLNSEYFASYVKEFDKWSEIKNLKKRQSFKALSTDEQKAVLDMRLVEYLKTAEKDKMYYFVLASLNPQPVLIIKSPSKTKEMKAFLGYEWSSAKGNEGIKYLGGTKLPEEQPVDEDSGEVALEEEDKRVLSNLYNLENINTPLYNPKDKQDANKINHLISQNFQKEAISISEELKPFVTKARLMDMLDFTVVDFNKAISLTLKEDIKIDTKWDLVRISDIAETSSGGTPKSDNHQFYDGGTIPWLNSGEVKNGLITGTKNYITEEGLKNSSAKIFPIDTVLVAMYGATAGQVGILKFTSSTNQAVCGMITNEKCLPMYLFYFLSTQLENLLKLRIGVARLNLSQGIIQNSNLPLPPIDVQKQIIDECQIVDHEVEKAKDSIKDISQLIEKGINEYYRKSYPIKKLNDFALFNPSKSEVSSRQDNLEVSFIEMSSVNEKGYIDYKEDRLLKDVKQGSYKYFAENDIIIAKITPCMENGKCAIVTGLTNNIGFGSSEFHVIRVDSEISSSNYVFAFLNRETIRQEAEKHVTGSSGHRRVPASFYQNLEIPLPSLDEQIELVNTVSELQDRISQAQALIDASVGRKYVIIQSYL